MFFAHYYIGCKYLFFLVFFKCLPRLFAFWFSLCVLGVAPGAACLLPVRPSTHSPVCSVLSVKTRFCTEPATCSSLSMRRIEHKYKLFYLSNSFSLFCVIICFQKKKNPTVYSSTYVYSITLGLIYINVHVCVQST